MHKAKVFKPGNSQAVRLPKAVRFGTSEVDIFRRGEETVLREAKPHMRRAVEAFRELASLIEIPDDSPPEAVEPRRRRRTTCSIPISASPFSAAAATC